MIAYMISHLAGTVTYANGSFAIIDVSGVGYKVHATAQTLAVIHIGEKLTLWTYLAVRESALDLYGFLEYEELGFFEKLLLVSGIGPKSALAIMGLAPVATLSSAILSRDPAYLTKISGIGKKTAQKIILELHDKLTNIGAFSPRIAQGDTDILLALESLGYSSPSAREAVQKLPDTIQGTNDRLKEALKLLGSTR